MLHVFHASHTLKMTHKMYHTHFSYVSHTWHTSCKCGTLFMGVLHSINTFFINYFWMRQFCGIHFILKIFRLGFSSYPTLLPSFDQVLPYFPFPFSAFTLSKPPLPPFWSSPTPLSHFPRTYALSSYFYPLLTRNLSPNLPFISLNQRTLVL